MEVATRDREGGGKYTWTTSDSDRLLGVRQKMEKPQPQKRKKGDISKSRTVKALTETKQDHVVLKVKGRNMKTTTLSNVQRLKLSFNSIWRKHMKSKFTVTEQINIDPDIGLFKFKKVPTDELKARIDSQLIVDAKEAEEKILEKLERTRKAPADADCEIQEMVEKKKSMKRSTAWKSCLYCHHLAGEQIVILAASAKEHYRSYHQAHNDGVMDPLAFPVIKVLEKD